MFLHDIDFDKFDIAHEDTLLSPQHWDDEPFEVIVSNPPYRSKYISTVKREKEFGENSLYLGVFL